MPFFFTSTAGHGAYNHDPDQTYNVRDFQNNEMRTMRMAEEVFGQIQSFAGDASIYSWREIAPTVLDFVRTGQLEGNAATRWADRCLNPFQSTIACNAKVAAAAARHDMEVANKAKVLEAKLVLLGLANKGDMDTQTGRLNYKKAVATARRTINLQGLNHTIDPSTGRDRFVGVLLPGD